MTQSNLQDRNDTYFRGWNRTDPCKILSIPCEDKIGFYLSCHMDMDCVIDNGARQAEFHHFLDHRKVFLLCQCNHLYIGQDLFLNNNLDICWPFFAWAAQECIQFCNSVSAYKSDDFLLLHFFKPLKSNFVSRQRYDER